jgi:hypothetical protein
LTSKDPILIFLIIIKEWEKYQCEIDTQNGPQRYHADENSACSHLNGFVPLDIEHWWTERVYSSIINDTNTEKLSTKISNNNNRNKINTKQKTTTNLNDSIGDFLKFDKTFLLNSKNNSSISIKNKFTATNGHNNLNFCFS